MFISYLSARAVIGHCLLLFMQLAIVLVGAERQAAWAEPSKMVMVNVREVRAMGRHRESLAIDSRLDDLKTKFAALRFAKFKLVSSANKAIKLKSKETIDLAKGQTLCVRPLYIKEDRVGLWLQWNDKAGNEILDTRMHFDSAESMLAGTDTKADTATILAIDVKPIN